MDDLLDAVVIGGGPAGLAAALWLARYRLRTCLFDSDEPRNAATWAVHGYLGVEDPAPDDLRAIARRQAETAGAVLRRGCVVAVEGEKDDFAVRLDDRSTVRARRVLFATGLRDIIPEIEGLLDFYGSSIWHCPDCDGPGTTGLEVGVIGWGRQIAAFCMEMLTWTDRLTIFTHGRQPELPAASREALERFGIPVVTDPIERLEGSGGLVQRVVLHEGRTREVEAMFFHIAYGPGCSIPASLGCAADQDAILRIDEDFETTVPGVYAAGDITPGSKLAIRAAADGTRAAIGIYRSLLPPERRV
jgi:thioredoxin reductase